MRPRRWFVAAAACALMLAACNTSDDAAPPESVQSPGSVESPGASGTVDAGPPATAIGGVTPEGFDTIGVTIRDANEATRQFCLWLAATPDQRQRGLMGVTDLAGKSGMLFGFDEDTQEAFWMFQTVTPLSIAFFDSRGEFVSSTDMAPCTGTSDTCPTYAAAAPYRDAIEVPQGTLSDLGIGAGSAIVDRGACPA